MGQLHLVDHPKQTPVAEELVSQCVFNIQAPQQNSRDTQTYPQYLPKHYGKHWKR